MKDKKYICTSVDDVCEQLKKGKYVFTYVELKGGIGIKYISAYHLCDYGLEAFSLEHKSNKSPLKLCRADVHFADHIDNLEILVKEHMTERFAKFSAFVVCDSMLDLDNIGKPTRFKPYPTKSNKKINIKENFWLWVQEVT